MFTGMDALCRAITQSGTKTCIAGLVDPYESGTFAVLQRILRFRKEICSFNPRLPDTAAQQLAHKTSMRFEVGQKEIDAIC